MRALARFSTLLAVTALAGPAPAEEPTGDLARLQGAWTAKGGPNKDIPLVATVKGHAFQITGPRPDGGEFRLSGELKLDEKASPKRIDWVKVITRNGDDMADILGLYRLEGETWTTCGGGPGNPRPAEFEQGEGGPPGLTTWTKAKEGAEDKPIPGDLGKLQGTWAARSGANDEVEIAMTIRGNAYTASWERGDGTRVDLKGELRVNEKATPHKTVDFFDTKSGGEGVRDSLGLYRFDGEKVEFCVGDPGEERPTEFQRGTDGPPHLLSFARKKG